MGAEAIVAIGFVLLLLGGASFAMWSEYRRGKTAENLKDAERERDDATEQIQRRTDPVLDDRSYRDRLRRASERLARLRDRATKR